MTMKPLSILCAIAAVAIYASDKPAPAPKAMSELTVLQNQVHQYQLRVDELTKQLADCQAKSASSSPVVQPVAAKPSEAATGGAVTGHYEYRYRRYGLFGGRTERYTVWVQDKPYADGLQPPVRYYSRGCTSGRCGRW